MLHAIVAVVSLCLSTTDEAVPAWHAQAELLAEPLLAEGVVPGLAIGVILDGESGFLGLGSTDHGKQSPPTPTTVYEIGSISKAMTGLLLAEAVLRGELSIDDPIDGALPPEIHPPRMAGEPITYKGLVTHTSGLHRMPRNLRLTSEKDPYVGYDDTLLWAEVDGFRTTVAPGVQSVYSNLGFGLLGTAMSRQIGLSFDEQLSERLTKPLGLVDTTIDLDADQFTRLAPPLTMGGRAASNWHFKAMRAAGAVRSTAADMTKLAEAMLDPPTPRFVEVVDLALKQQWADRDGDQRIGLGWQLTEGGTAWHNGMTGAYTAAFLVHRPTKTAVVVLANAPADAVTGFAFQLLLAINGREAEPPEVRRSIGFSNERLLTYTGTYRSAFGGIMRVVVEGRGLGVSIEGAGDHPFVPTSAADFFSHDTPVELRFSKFDENGIPSEVFLRQGLPVRFTRVENDD